MSIDGVPASATDVIISGQTVTIECQSSGGYPDPQLTLTRNDEKVGTVKEFRNTHTFIASDEDNNALFKCLAQNSQMDMPEVAEMVFQVHCK